MKTNFNILADKFSVLNEQETKDFISFYEKNQREIEGLKDFETEEELYLSAVINHTYGRSLLYEVRDREKAARYLEMARSLILSHKTKFNLALNEDIWYLQTLQHLLRISLDSGKDDQSKKLLQELTLIDPENKNEYQRAEQEINRAKRYKIFMALLFCGMGLTLVSMVYRFVTSTTMGPIDRVGTAIGLLGIIGAYIHRKIDKG